MQDEDLKQSVRGLMYEIFRIDPTKSPASFDIDNIANWDSLGHLALIDAISSTYKVDISQAQSIELLSEEEIVRFLKNYE